MDSFFDLIFKNPFLLFIIITALFSMFNRKKKAEQQERQRTGKEQQEPRQTQKRTETRTEQSRPPLADTLKRAKEMIESLDDSTVTKKQDSTRTNDERETRMPLTENSFENERNLQFERLRQQYQTAAHEEDNLNETFVSEQMNQTNNQIKRQEIGEINLSSKLTSKGLIESVIMAEVLGPPRARKKHHNLLSRK